MKSAILPIKLHINFVLFHICVYYPAKIIKNKSEEKLERVCPFLDSNNFSIGIHFFKVLVQIHYSHSPFPPWELFFLKFKENWPFLQVFILFLQLFTLFYSFLHFFTVFYTFLQFFTLF